MRRTAPAIALLLTLGFLAPQTPAYAADPFSPDTLSGLITAGPAVGSGERSWLSGGEGKLQSGQGELSALGSGILDWRPVFSDRIGASASLIVQSGGQAGAGLDEAYLIMRPDPTARWRISGRAGLFYPPISLEHDGPEWSVVRTLTPSVINSWVAEEVKTVGFEGTVRGSLAGQPLGLTVAAIEGNETSGALLAFRGWALHDLQSTLSGSFELPALPDSFVGKQAPRTRSIDEVDGRWGGYAKFDWAPREHLTLSAFAYDNNGDRSSVVDGQYAWRTTFGQVALRWNVDANTEVLAQAMTGETAMGKRSVSGPYPVDADFSAAYVLVSHNVGPGTIAMRLDQFSMVNHSLPAIDNDEERGWAATAAWSQPILRRVELVFEGVYVHSDRPDRARFGLGQAQDSLQARSALRMSF